MSTAPNTSNTDTFICIMGCPDSLELACSQSEAEIETMAECGLSIATPVCSYEDFGVMWVDFQDIHGDYVGRKMARDLN